MHEMSQVGRLFALVDSWKDDPDEGDNSDEWVC